MFFVRHLLRTLLGCGLLALSGMASVDGAESSGLQGSAEDPLPTRLEQALNSAGGSGLTDLLAGEQALALQNRYRIFSAQFPDARWSVSEGAALEDGRQTFNIAVSGSQEQGGVSYSLEANQRLVLSTEAGRIVGQEVIGEQSVMRNTINPLPISLIIPDAVLTGSRYDVDVILDQPLGDALVAGGLISLSPRQVQDQFSPDIQLEPLGGGGLFKSVKAPLLKGHQTWAALLVHPDGLISVSKRVRVVDNKAALTP